MFIIENMQNTEKIHKKSSINLHLRENTVTHLSVCIHTYIYKIKFGLYMVLYLISLKFSIIL